MASGSSLDELLNAEFKEAFNEFDKVGRIVIVKHSGLLVVQFSHVVLCEQLYTALLKVLCSCDDIWHNFGKT